MTENVHLGDIIIRKEKNGHPGLPDGGERIYEGKEKDVRKLMRYAAAMGIEDKVRTYTEEKRCYDSYSDADQSKIRNPSGRRQQEITDL